MAVHAVCEFCRHKFSVPDNLKGKKIGCPSCGKKTRVLTALDLSVEEGRRKHETSQLLKKKQESEQAPSQPESTPVVKQETVSPPGPATRYPALLTLKSVFTFFAYLVALLAIAVGLMLFLQVEDPQYSWLLLLGFFIGAVLSFCLFRLLAESARLGADLGDMESRMLELLLDIRDKLDKLGR
jgi:hypothetical protein